MINEILKSSTIEYEILRALRVGLVKSRAVDGLIWAGTHFHISNCFEPYGVKCRCIYISFPIVARVFLYLDSRYSILSINWCNANISYKRTTTRFYLMIGASPSISSRQ